MLNLSRYIIFLRLQGQSTNHSKMTDPTEAILKLTVRTINKTSQHCIPAGHRIQISREKSPFLKCWLNTINDKALHLQANNVYWLKMLNFILGVYKTALNYKRYSSLSMLITIYIVLGLYKLSIA